MNPANEVIRVFSGVLRCSREHQVHPVHTSTRMLPVLCSRMYVQYPVHRRTLTSRAGFGRQSGRLFLPLTTPRNSANTTGEPFLPPATPFRAAPLPEVPPTARQPPGVPSRARCSRVFSGPSNTPQPTRRPAPAFNQRSETTPSGPTGSTSRGRMVTKQATGLELELTPSQ